MKPQVFTRDKTIDVGPTQTYIAEAGDGPPILLLHGNPDTHLVWSDVVSSLSASHRCIAPDLPGFGQSRAPADFDCSLENMSRHVAGVLDGLNLSRAHMVAHDVGSTYGLAFATTHPERLLSLTILNGNFFPDYQWHFWARLWRRRGVGELVMAVANRRLFVSEMRKGSPGVTREYAERAYADYGRDTRRMVLRWYRAMGPEVLRGWDERFLRDCAGVPKQVLWGDLDPYVPASTADRYGVEARHYPDCGHWLMLDRPDEVATHIANHVDAHPAPSA